MDINITRVQNKFRSNADRKTNFKVSVKWLVKKVFRLMIYVLLFDLAFVYLFPFIYMIVTSFKAPEDLVDFTVRWVPKSLYVLNYQLAYACLQYITFFKNSVFVTAFCIAGHVLSCSFIAYGFARFKFPGRDLLFTLVILSLLVPVQVIIMPLFMRYSSLGWMNTYLPLIVPTFTGFGLRGGLFIFIFRQFFLGLPVELENAAKIDGCGPLKTYLNIILPCSSTPALTCSVLAMVWHWNDYYEPTLYLNSASKLMLPAMIPNMIQAAKRTSQEIGLNEEILFNDAVIMAGIFLVILPILLVYLLMQKRFIQGLERSGLGSE